ncbi:MAG: head-tail adaptor protein [Christensenellales bacterium]|jgi:head-tail adaptor
MAKFVRIGEMRTRITIKRVIKGLDADGHATHAYEDVFPGRVWCKWVWQHGTEVFESMRLNLGQVATITMPYTPKITPQCRIWRESETTDADAWEVVSIDNVEEANRYLEIKVRRDVKA